MGAEIITTCFGAVDLSLCAVTAFRSSYEIDDPDINRAADDAVAALASLSAMLAGKGKAAMDRERGKQAIIDLRSYTSHFSALISDARSIEQFGVSFVEDSDEH